MLDGLQFCDARVQEQYVDSAKRLLNGFDDLGLSRDGGGVGRDDEDFIAKFVPGGFKRRRVPSCDRDPGSLLGEVLRGFEANAAGAAGYECALSLSRFMELPPG